MTIIEQIRALEEIKRTLKEQLEVVYFHPGLYMSSEKEDIYFESLERCGWQLLEGMVAYESYCGYGSSWAKPKSEINSIDRELIKRINKGI